MNSQQAFVWEFGGWTGIPPWIAWSVLLFLAASGVALAVFFYRETLQTLRPRQRLIFILLRLGFFLALLLCLADPSRVERTIDTGPGARPLAVIVDRSASMTTPDTAGGTRLASASKVWRDVKAAAHRSFPKLTYFSFTTGLRHASDFGDALTQTGSSEGTAFYNSLGETLKSAPAGGYAGIVCLTDGLDTTRATSDLLVAEALHDHTPLYFVVGQNRQVRRDTLLVRDTQVPGQVLRKSDFNATALIEAQSATARDVPLSLQQDDQLVAQATVHLRAGANLVPWSVPVHSNEPGLLRLTWRLGEGAEQEALNAAVRVVAQNQVGVLFYQGTLDWGFRFICGALQSDPGFTVTGLVNPDLTLSSTAPTVGGAPAASAAPLTSLPDSVAGLRPYQIVVIGNAVADQLSAAQQTALSDYVREGGGLLFLISDTNMASTFSGTPLESILPVVFEPKQATAGPDPALAAFQNQMHAAGGSSPPDEGQFAANALLQDQASALLPFGVPPHATASAVARLFAGTPSDISADAPKFSTYAKVASVKAGAELLAVNPADTAGATSPPALLVTQRFGQGQVTAMLTDALWRWKLSLPSTSTAPEKFWQQLFLAMAGPPGTMRLSLHPAFASLGEHAAFQVEKTIGSAPPVIVAVAPAGTEQPVTLQPGPHPGSFTFEVVPNAPGPWRIRVEDERGAQIETMLRVNNIDHSAELSGLPADEEGLRNLAQLTGGNLLNDGPPDTWSNGAVPDEPTMISEHHQPLWNTWELLLIALACYATELIWRRRARLL